MVIEKHLASCAGNPDGGLDGIVATDRRVAVIDVATPKSGSLTVAQTLKSTLLEALTQMESGRAPKDAVAELTSVAADLDGRAAAVVAVYEKQSDVIWRVGDCWVRADRTTWAGTHALERKLASVRATFDLAALLDGMAPEDVRRTSPGRQLILPALRSMEQLMNHPDPACEGRIGVINGNPVPEDLVEVVPVPRGQRVVLATDGYLELSHDLDATERCRRARAARDPLLLADPPTTKPIAPAAEWHDDRAYVSAVSPDA